MTIPQAIEGGTWKLQSVSASDVAGNYGYSSFPAGTPTDLIVVDRNPVTDNNPAIYHYKGYVTGVSVQPFGLKIGDPVDLNLALFLSPYGGLTGGANGHISSSGFATKPYPDYTTVSATDGSPDTVDIEGFEGCSDFYCYAGISLQLRDPSGRALNATGPIDILSGLRSGDWPRLSATFSCNEDSCDGAPPPFTVNVRGSFPLETELLTVQSKTPPPSGISPAQWSGVFNASAASNSAGTYFNATAPGQFITYGVPVLHTGTYRVLLGVQMKPNKGKFQLAIDGINQGFVQDEFSQGVSYASRDLGTVVFTSTGNKAFTFTVTGRNPSSTGYTLAFDYLHLVPSLRLETESLKVQSITPVPSGYTSARWFGKFIANAASGGAGTYFNANAVGDYITYTVPVVKPGTYHVRVGTQTKPNKGIFQLAVNGLNVGPPQDEYSAAAGYAVSDLGTVTLGVAGNQAFQFLVAGKNPSSSGYTLGFDYIELVP